MRATPTHYRTENSLIQLWYHEVRRVFEDRFINDDDIKAFRAIAKEGLVKNFGEFNEK